MATALQSLEMPIPNLNIQAEQGSIELQVPEEFERRYKRLLKEILPGDKKTLTTQQSPQSDYAGLGGSAAE